MYTEPDVRSNKFLIFLAVGVILLLAYAVINFEKVSQWFEMSKVYREKAVLTEKIAALEEEIAALKNDNQAMQVPVSNEKIEEVFGTETPATPETDTEEALTDDPCKKLQNQVVSLFHYLDNQDYISAYELPHGMHHYFKNVLPQLLKKPPIVVRETDTLLRVLKNSAHFYRTLGKKNTFLLREILKKETTIVEPTFELLYQIMEKTDECKESDLDIHLTMKNAYDYAAYFLNTIGGRSYLMRRDSRTRMLTQYYSILIVDQSNQGRFNEWGIDIRYPLDSLIEEINSSNNLARKKDYLTTLNALRKNYRALYGNEEVLSSD